MPHSTMPPKTAAKTAIVATVPHQLDAGKPARPTNNADVLIRHAQNCNVSRANEARLTYQHYSLIAFDHESGRARLQNPQGKVYVVNMRTFECGCDDFRITLRKVADDVARAGYLEPIMLCKHSHMVHMIVCDEVAAQGVDPDEIEVFTALDFIPNAIKRVYPDLPRFPVITEKEWEMDWK